MKSVNLNGSHWIRRAGVQDLETDVAREQASLLNEIAMEEANNQWKTDIASIAANTDPISPGDSPLALDAPATPVLPGESSPVTSGSGGGDGVEREVMSVKIVEPVGIRGPVSVDVNGTVPVSLDHLVNVLVTNFPEQTGGGGGLTLSGLIQEIVIGQTDGILPTGIQ